MCRYSIAGAVGVSGAMKAPKDRARRERERVRLRRADGEEGNRAVAAVGTTSNVHRVKGCITNSGSHGETGEVKMRR
jgi:hypothetical protein